MKKKIAMLLTCSLLFTMMPAAFAGPGQGRTSDRARSEERARDRDRDREIKRIADVYGIDLIRPEDNDIWDPDERGQDTEERTGRYDDEFDRNKDSLADRTLKIDQWIDEMTKIDYTSEEEENKTLSDIQKSLKKMSEISIPLIRKGLKFKASDSPISTIPGLHTTFDLQEFDWDMPYGYSSEENTIYFRLGQHQVSRLTRSQNNVMRAVAEQFVRECGIDVLEEEDDDVEKRLSGERKNFADRFVKDRFRRKIDGGKYAFSEDHEQLIVKSELQIEGDKRYLFHKGKKLEVMQDSSHQDYVVNPLAYQIRRDSISGQEYIIIDGQKITIQEEPSFKFKYITKPDYVNIRYVIGSAPPGVSIQKTSDGSLYFEANQQPYFVKILHKKEGKISTNELELSLDNKIIMKDCTPIRVIAEDDRLFVEETYDVQSGAHNKKFVKMHGRIYPIEKGGDSDFYVRDREEFNLARDYFMKGPTINFLSEAVVMYFNGDEAELEQHCPQTYYTIRKFIESGASFEPITEHEIDETIKTALSVERIANVEQLQGWQKQAISDFKQAIKMNSPVILGKLRQEGLQLHLMFKFIFEHSLYKHEYFAHCRNLPSSIDAKAITSSRSMGRYILYTLYPEGVYENSLKTYNHEFGHAVDLFLYDQNDQPSLGLELKKIMEDDMAKGSLNRFFKEDHYYKKTEEYWAEAYAWYTTDEEMPGEDLTYRERLKNDFPELFDFVHKKIQETEGLDENI